MDNAILANTLDLESLVEEFTPTFKTRVELVVKLFF